MKIALCLYGIIGGDSGKGGAGSSENVLHTGYEYYYNNVLNNPDNEVDVFLHTWSIEHHKAIVEIYEPKDYVIEPQIIFNIPEWVCGDKQRKQNHYSRWYSTRQTIRLKQEYEFNNKFTYDMVMVNRFDTYFEDKFLFTDYDPHYFWAGKWCEIWHGNKDIYKGDRGPYQQWVTSNDDRLAQTIHRHKSFEREGLIDWWFFSNSYAMNRFSTLYDYLDDYTHPDSNCQNDKSGRISNHRLAYYHLQQIQLATTIKTTLHSCDDYGLIRRRLLGCKK